MSEENKGDNGQELLTATGFSPPKAADQPNYLIMETEDRLRAENLQLKLMNMALKEKELLAQLELVRGTTMELQKQYLKLQIELSQKYGVDLTVAQVRSSDGAIVPRPGAAQPQPPSVSPKP